ncbi:glycosyltransferase family 9 protein [Rubellicoccus peritrichatus]|uniref:Glycosyltransferase family 9 protein n=1 Tax=Rubellicoccus peritrichatus TaxID=3080537 RepID=A0AAQ3LDI9_9BACT|nr:glycosyltransferase family 9 protein [Puniceicoccus sp. CR14]WOO42444.1 glycosyltransferase family 9 protein [Puniceicoccus sp. CR14]
MKILLIELWGLGDGVLMTGALKTALEADHDVTVLCQPTTCKLLSSSFPQVTWIEFVMPWTPHKRKYHLWIWPWRALIQLIVKLRRERFEMVLSARPDPREHFLMFLVGSKQRISLSHFLGKPFLSESLEEHNPPMRRSEAWNGIMTKAGFKQVHQPWLDSSLKKAFSPKLSALSRPFVVLHTGAGHPIRRWQDAYWMELLDSLKDEFNFSLILIPQPGDKESKLSLKADTVLENLDLDELVAVLAKADALFCHDSGPMHIAEALGTQVFSIFGAGSDARFGPWRQESKHTRLNNCPHHPCKDRCHFKEPICLTELKPDAVFREAKPWLENILQSTDQEMTNP